MPRPLLFPYNAIELTEQVNIIPNSYGMLEAEGLFPAEGFASRIVEISRAGDQLVVLSADEPGGDGDMIERDSQNSVFVKIPYFAMPDRLGPEDLQGLIEVVGAQRESKSFDRELAKILKRIRLSHAMTLEFIRIGALKGLVKDGRGRTLLDLRAKFEVQKKTVFFNLASSTQSILDKCTELTDFYAENLRGETMSEVEVKVSGEFFSALIQHPKVEKYWLQTQSAQALANVQNRRVGGAWGRRFVFGEIAFQEYKGFMALRQADGSIVSQRVIDAGVGHAYPVGTQNVFRTFRGPVHHIEHVNEVADAEVFISPKVLDHGDGVELKSQSNAIAIAKRPDLLVDVSMAAN